MFSSSICITSIFLWHRVSSHYPNPYHLPSLEVLAMLSCRHHLSKTYPDQEKHWGNGIAAHLSLLLSSRTLSSVELILVRFCLLVDLPRLFYLRSLFRLIIYKQSKTKAPKTENSFAAGAFVPGSLSGWAAVLLVLLLQDWRKRPIAWDCRPGSCMPRLLVWNCGFIIILLWEGYLLHL